MDKCQYYKLGIKIEKINAGGAYNYVDIRVPYSYCKQTGNDCKCNGDENHCEICEKKESNK